MYLGAVECGATIKRLSQVSFFAALIPTGQGIPPGQPFNCVHKLA